MARLQPPYAYGSQYDRETSPDCGKSRFMGRGPILFRIQIKTGRVFDLYYDRAPDSASDREGHWFLWREMSPAEKEQDP